MLLAVLTASRRKPLKRLSEQNGLGSPPPRSSEVLMRPGRTAS